MDSLDQIKGFISDIVKPIVTDAVTTTKPQPEVKPAVKFISVKEAIELYPTSRSSIYRAINSGELTKFKNRGRTALKVEQVDAMFKPETLTGISAERTIKH